MPYQVQTQVIHGGTLNLSVPANLAGEDSIALHNWRTDKKGALRSRLSASEFATGYSTPIHTLYRDGNNRYVGGGTNLYRNTTSIASGFDGTPVGIVSFLDQAWVMNQSVQGVDRGGTFYNGFLPAVPGAWSVTPAAGGGLVDNVDYRYFITFLTSEGFETNPTEASAVFTPGSGDNSASIAHPGTADARVNRWNVYRIGNTLEAVYRVNRTPLDISTGTFIDTGAGADLFDDVEVTRLGVEMREDNDAPPAAAILVGPYYGRLIAFNTAAHPNWMYWTPAWKPYAWPGAALDEGNHTPVGEDDEVVAVTMHPGHLRIYCKRSVWRLRGDPETGVLERINANIGLTGRKAICTVSGLDYFQTMEGIYVGNGDSVRKLSSVLDPLFSGSFNFLPGVWPNQQMNGSYLVKANNCLAVKDGRLLFSYAAGVATSPDAMLSCDLESGRWASEDSTYGGWTAINYEGQERELMAAAGSKIYVLDYPTTELVTVRWLSSYRDQGAPDNKKRYADLVIEHSCKRGHSADRNLTVKLRYDSGEVEESIGSLAVATTSATGDAWVRTTLAVGADQKGTEGRNAALLIEGETDTEVVIYSGALHYYVEPREGLTFDTGRIDLNDPRVKELDLMRLVVMATADLDFELYTDLPGTEMASRQTGTLAVAGAGEMETLDTMITPEARWLRLVVTSASPLRVYGCFFRYSVAAVHLDGTRSQYEESSDIMLNAA